VADSSEHGNEPSGFTKRGNSLASWATVSFSTQESLCSMVLDG